MSDNPHIGSSFESNQMAKRMRTSRAYLDRFLDPANDKVQLDTLQRTAAAVGRRLRLELA